MPSWKQEFIRGLAAVGRDPNYRIVWVIRSIRLYPPGLDGREGKGVLQLTNARGIVPGEPCIISCRITGPRVTIRDWSTVVGQANIEVDTSNWATWGEHCRRGEPVEILAGFPGWDIDDFERVFFGPIRNVSRSGPGRATIEILGPERLLSTRWDVRDNTHALYPGSISSDTTLTFNYTAGAVSLTVVSTAGFERSSYSGHAGLVRVTPTTGDVFYLTWSAKTGTVFTVGVAAALGTTAVNAVVGDAVHEMWYARRHPIEVALQILVSTGTASENGTYDVLPETWGMGWPYDLVDRQDSQMWQTKTTPSSGNQVWTLATAQQQDDVWSWVSGWLAEGGFFLTMLQGRITVRAAIDPNLEDSWTTGRTIELTNEHEILGFSTRHPDCEIEYDIITLTAADGTESSFVADGDADTLPAVNTNRMDLNHIYASATEWQTEIKQRIGPWWTRIPQELTIRCGLANADLAPGDVVEIVADPSLFIPGATSHTRNGINRVRGWVQSVSWSDSNSSVILELALLPVS